MMYILPALVIVFILRNGIDHISPLGWVGMCLLILSTTFTHFMIRQARKDEKGET